MTISERDQQVIAAYNDLKTYPTVSDVSIAFGLSPKTIRNIVGMLRTRKKLGESIPEIIERVGTAKNIGHEDNEFRSIPVVDGYDEPIEDLLSRVFTHNERYAAYHQTKELLDIEIKVRGAFGVVGIPDPHLNNPGCELRRAFSEAQIIRDHPALFCVGIGDWLDNFIIGRLERERRGDIMSHADANRIQDHYVTLLLDKLIAAIGGNHNDWVKSLGGTDILREKFKEWGADAIYDADQVRVRLKCPNGAEFVHLARHQFPGHSKYNSVHGVLSWALDRWQGEDVMWGGHIHAAGHIELEREFMTRSKVVHAIQLAAFKKIDHYAMARGFRKNVPFTSPMVVHDPERGKTVFFSDMEEGVRYLDMLRSK